jgi:hypothetical protein
VVAVPFVRFASNERAETTLAFLAECFEVLDAGLRRLKLGAMRRLTDNSVGRVIGLFGVGPVGVCCGAGWPLPLVDDGAGVARVGQVVAEAGEDLAEPQDVSVDVEADLGRARGHAAACCDSS